MEIEKVLGCMATWNRKEISIQSIESYLKTCNPDLMDLFVVDNGSTDGMSDWLKSNQERLLERGVYVVYNPRNLGTARAINSVWERRTPTQHCMKIDSDVCWLESDWLPKMLEVFTYTKNIGIVGLKREDVWEKPDHENPFYRTKILRVNRGDGTEFVIEQARHIIGTAWLVRSTLINTLGALVQPGLYGFDDALYCLRAEIAGFASVFLPDVPIEHIDPGEAGGKKNADYTKWKLAKAGDDLEAYEELRDAYQKGRRPLYEPFSVELEDEDPFLYSMGQTSDTAHDLEEEGLMGLIYGE